MRLHRPRWTASGSIGLRVQCETLARRATSGTRRPHAPKPCDGIGPSARLSETDDAARRRVCSGGTEDLVIARIATFEGGDAEEMRRINNQMLIERSTSPLPSGLLRVIVLMKDE